MHCLVFVVPVRERETERERDPPKFRESAREAAYTALGPAAWIYNAYTSSDRFYTCPPPLCLPATLLVRSADSVSFVLVPISRGAARGTAETTLPSL